MSSRTKLYMWCFVIALSLRLLVLYQTPFRNEDIDLKIYRATGLLVANGVNPYDFNDNVELRQQLRTSKDNYNGWICSDQDKWNYYANGNLPLASLFFGGIEYCFSSAKAFRLCFAFFDSILAVLVLAFVLTKWKFRFPQNRIFDKLPPKIRSGFPIFIGLSLGAFSPLLLLWGTFIPGPKGMGVLLMLSSIYFSDSKNKILSLFVSPVLLGFSVAFIGLGVFVTPLCLYNIYKNNKYGFWKIVIYSIVSFSACAISLVPFMPELITMMSNRIRLAVQPVPEHGSMWSVVYTYLPDYWVVIKKVFMVIFLSINVIGLLRKRIDLSLLSASLLYLVTNVYLVNGSMDRMNIALLTLILLFGYSKFISIATLHWFVYFLFGLFAFYYSYYLGRGMRQDWDGIFVLSFTVLYFTFLVVQTFARKSLNYETVSS